MPKQSVVRPVLGCCLALGLVVWMGGAPVAHAQVVRPAPRGTSAPPQPVEPCAQIPCASITTGSTWCWCPDQPLLISPDPIETGPGAGYVVGIDNRLPVEVDLVDRSGQLAAAIPPGATGRLAVPGPGRYAYTVAAPQVVRPPVLTVVGQPN